MVRRHEPHGDHLEEDAAVPDQIRHEEEHVFLLLALGGLLVLGGRGHGCRSFGTLSLPNNGEIGQIVIWEIFIYLFLSA